MPIFSMQRVDRFLALFKALDFAGEALLAHHSTKKTAHHFDCARLEFPRDRREFLGAALGGAEASVGRRALAARERECPNALHCVHVVADPRVAQGVRRSNWEGRRRLGKRPH